MAKAKIDITTTKFKNPIVLSNPELGEEIFERSHAEKILAWDLENKQTTWTLHDPKLKFEDGKIITGASNGNSQSAD